ncbi:hypothetical protein M153_2560002935 [Pseudoloma neurophilia]|uniref:Eukaryotic translation initiation factor 3 subunit G N-terminal domain-containing protein n=1 Tax=Pseudoloma neurophilia TaxID=146866 RepID=A0A0R0M4D9_9MICR|nr:hypothetical protein M153_2560002935 [Pseudoloma neurophilia]
MNSGDYLHQWLKGIEASEFNSTSELKATIIELFGEEENQEILRKCMEIIHRGFRLNNLLEDVCFLFGNKNRVTLSREEMVDLGTRSLLSSYSEPIKNTQDWQELIKVIVRLERNSERDKEIQSRLQGQKFDRDSTQKVVRNQKVTTLSSKEVPKNEKKPLECWICKGAHYSNKCPNKTPKRDSEKFVKSSGDNKNRSNDSKSLELKNFIMEKVIIERPHILGECNGQKIWCLIYSDAADNFMSGATAIRLSLEMFDYDGFCNTAAGRSKVTLYTMVNLKSKD